MDKKQKWTEDILGLAEMVQRVEMPADLSENIMRQFLHSKGRIVTMPSYTKWAIAASIALLIGINSFTLLRFSSTKNVNQSSLESNVVYTEYFSFANFE